jgi:hypothetical protein
MSKVRLYGDTSGFVDLKAPDVASNVTITLPNTAGPFATEAYVDTAAASAGGLVAVHAVNKTDTFSLTNTSFTDVTGMSVTFTPTDASNTLIVMCSLMVSRATANRGWFFVVTDGSDVPLIQADADGVRTRAVDSTGHQSADSSNAVIHMTERRDFSFTYAPGSAASLTVKLRAACQGTDALYLNRTVADSNSTAYGRGVSSLTVMEVRV